METKYRKSSGKHFYFEKISQITVNHEISLRKVYKIKLERKAEMEIINAKVDGLLTELEGIFKEAVEKNKEAQEELDKSVKVLIDEHDKKEEVKRYVEVKDLSDYIALTLSMPIEDETKERVVEEIVKVIKNGREVKESV